MFALLHNVMTETPHHRVDKWCLLWDYSWSFKLCFLDFFISETWVCLKGGLFVASWKAFLSLHCWLSLQRVLQASAQICSFHLSPDSFLLNVLQFFSNSRPLCRCLVSYWELSHYFPLLPFIIDQGKKFWRELSLPASLSFHISALFFLFPKEFECLFSPWVSFNLSYTFPWERDQRYKIPLVHSWHSK